MDLTNQSNNNKNNKDNHYDYDDMPPLACAYCGMIWDGDGPHPNGPCKGK